MHWIRTRIFNMCIFLISHLNLTPNLFTEFVFMELTCGCVVQVATWVDDTLSSMASKLEHSAQAFPELQGERMVSLQCCALYTCVQLENSLYWWWVEIAFELSLPSIPSIQCSFWLLFLQRMKPVFKSVFFFFPPISRGVVPFSQRKKMLEKARAKNKKPKSSAGISSIPNITVGTQVRHHQKSLQNTADLTLDAHFNSFKHSSKLLFTVFHTCCQC